MSKVPMQGERGNVHRKAKHLLEQTKLPVAFSRIQQ